MFKKPFKLSLGLEFIFWCIVVSIIHTTLYYKFNAGSFGYKVIHLLGSFTPIKFPGLFETREGLSSWQFWDTLRETENLIGLGFILVTSVTLIKIKLSTFKQTPLVFLLLFLISILIELVSIAREPIPSLIYFPLFMVGGLVYLFILGFIYKKSSQGVSR